MQPQGSGQEPQHGLNCRKSGISHCLTETKLNSYTDLAWSITLVNSSSSCGQHEDSQAFSYHRKYPGWWRKRGYRSLTPNNCRGAPVLAEATTRRSKKTGIVRRPLCLNSPIITEPAVQVLGCSRLRLLEAAFQLSRSGAEGRDQPSVGTLPMALAIKHVSRARPVSALGNSRLDRAPLS